MAKGKAKRWSISLIAIDADEEPISKKEIQAIIKEGLADAGLKVTNLLVIESPSEE